MNAKNKQLDVNPAHLNQPIMTRLTMDDHSAVSERAYQNREPVAEFVRRAILAQLRAEEAESEPYLGPF